MKDTRICEHTIERIRSEAVAGKSSPADILLLIDCLESSERRVERMASCRDYAESRLREAHILAQDRERVLRDLGYDKNGTPLPPVDPRRYMGRLD